MGWVWNLVCYLDGRMQIEDVWEETWKELLDIRDANNGELERTALWIVRRNKYISFTKSNLLWAVEYNKHRKECIHFYVEYCTCFNKFGALIRCKKFLKHH